MYHGHEGLHDVGLSNFGPGMSIPTDSQFLSPQPKRSPVHGPFVLVRYHGSKNEVAVGKIVASELHFSFGAIRALDAFRLVVNLVHIRKGLCGRLELVGL